MFGAGCLRQSSPVEDYDIDNAGGDFVWLVETPFGPVEYRDTRRPWQGRKANTHRPRCIDRGAPLLR